jgi:ribonucleotide reductase alpha subunit
MPGKVTAVRKPIAAYPSISENALQVLEERYFRRDDKGNIVEDFDGMLLRVSTEFRPIEWFFQNFAICRT